MVATAATLIAYDLATASDLQVSAFFAFCVLLGPMVVLLWWLGRS